MNMSSPTAAVSVLAYDTETTGLIAGTDEIVSFAYYTLSADLDTLERGCIYAHPSAPEKMNPRAQAVNGYTHELWESRGAVPQSQLKSAILDTWRSTSVLGVEARAKPISLGHNISFDLGMLKATVGPDEVEAALGYHSECTMCIARFLDRANRVRGAKYSLVNLCERYEVELTNAHDAFSDITATVQLYRKLVLLVRENAQVPEPKKESFLVKEASGGFTFRHGKHKGKYLSEVPKDYLQWTLDKVKLVEEEIGAILATRDLQR